MVNYITFTQSRTFIYYFDDWDVAEEWELNPEYMVDGSTEVYAGTTINGDVQHCTHNTFQSDSLPTCSITKVELRSFSLANKQSCPTDVQLVLRPIFDAGDGDNHAYTPPNGTNTSYPDMTWSDWIDITTDTNAPATWTWDDVYSLDVDHYPIIAAGCGDVPTVSTAKIEIRISCSTDCNMISPEYVSDDHTQNVKMFNLWNGERIVFGQSRGNWSLNLKGRDWEQDACEKIQCIKNMGLAGKTVTLSGMNNINWDDDWLIRGLAWRIITECPVHYEWMILLEKAN